MKEILRFEELDLTKSMYVRVTSAPEVFLAGWTDGEAQAVVLQRAKGPYLYFSRGSSKSFYTQALLAATLRFGEFSELNINRELADELTATNLRHWNWLSKFDSALPDFADFEYQVVSDSHLNNRIQTFISRSGFDAHFLPGHPEVEFWVVNWNPEKTEIRAVAAGSKRISGLRVVNTVLVSPDHRNQGLGGKIAAAVVAEAAALGSEEFHLGVRGINPTAQRVYERLGFVVSEEMTEITL